MRNPLGSGGTCGANGGKRCQRVVSLYLILHRTQYSITNNNTKHNRRKLLYIKDLGQRGGGPARPKPLRAKDLRHSCYREREHYQRKRAKTKM